ncbi:hypothetical protein ACQBAR_16345 [Propionibacteriaceae bacterium Y1685]
MTRVIRGMVVAGSLAAACGVLAAQATQYRPPEIASTDTETPVVINDLDPEGQIVEPRSTIALRHTADGSEDALVVPVIRFITVDVIQN